MERVIPAELPAVETACQTESALVLDCGGSNLLGIASVPSACARSTGVVIVVGGPQYRAGSHRQFVLLARRLASNGFASLRFDMRGMGDSDGEAPGFLDCGPDIDAAIEQLKRLCPEVESVVIWALCDGASAALIHASGRSDVAGLVLLNPWVRSDETRAATHLKHYYRLRFLQADFWKKVWRGEFDFSASAASLLTAIGLTARLRSAKRSNGAATERFQSVMALNLRQFKGHVLLILSGNDFTAREFTEYAATDPDWDGVLDSPCIGKIEFPEADHTFSRAAWRDAVELATLDWLENLENVPQLPEGGNGLSRAIP